MQPRTLAPRAHWGNSSQPDALAVRVGRELGVLASTASQLLWGRDALNQRCARVIRVMHAFPESLVRWRDPLDTAFAAAPVEPLTDTLWLAEEEADASEGVAQVRAQLVRDRDSAMAYLRKLDAQIAHSTRLRRAIAQHWAVA